MGGRLITFNHDWIQKALIEKPALVGYSAYVDKIRGAFFLLKRLRKAIHLKKLSRTTIKVAL